MEPVIIDNTATILDGWQYTYLGRLSHLLYPHIISSKPCVILCETIKGDKYAVQFPDDIWHPDADIKLEMNTNCNGKGDKLRCLYISKKYVKLNSISPIELQLFAIL